MATKRKRKNIDCLIYDCENFLTENLIEFYCDVHSIIHTLYIVSNYVHAFVLLARYVANVAKEEYMRSV